MMQVRPTVQSIRTLRICSTADSGAPLVRIFAPVFRFFRVSTASSLGPTRLSRQCIGQHCRREHKEQGREGREQVVQEETKLS